MKKTIIALFALTSGAFASDLLTVNWGSITSTATSGQYAVNVSSSSGTDLTLTNPTSNTANKSTNIHSETFSPNTNVDNGGSWVLTFTLTNNTDAVVYVGGVNMGIYSFNGSSNAQDNDRNVVLTLAQEGTTLATSEFLLAGAGKDTTKDTLKTCTLDISQEKQITLNAGDSVTLTLTASQGTQVGENRGSYFGMTTTTFTTPEPATATLSLLALAGLAARRRRH